MRKKIVLVGNGPYQNRGCEAIVLGTLKILGESLPGVAVENRFFAGSVDVEWGAGARPGLTQDIPEIPLPSVYPAPRFSWPWALSKLGLILGPHDFGYLLFQKFQNSVANEIGTAYAALQIGGDNYSLDYGIPLQHAAIDALLTSRGVPVVLWGASVGPFNSKRNVEKWMVHHFRKNIGIILVRESKSLEYLQKVGLGARTFLMSDPAFVMEPTKPPDSLMPHDLPKSAIGVNLSPLILKFRDPKGDMECWVKEAADLIRALRDNLNAPLFLIPHVTKAGNNDYEFMLKAVRQAGLGEGDVSMISPNLTASELKWIISHLTLLIAARTHATIAGFSTCVPTISISYSIKSQGLNEQLFGNQDLVVPANRLSSELLLKVARTTIERSDEIHGRLVDIIPSIQKAAFSGGEILKQHLNRYYSIED